MTPRPTTSVLIPSYNRPAKLARCLDSMASQTAPPDEVLVVWQGDDEPTREAALRFVDLLGDRLKVLHNPVRGVVPAENLALDASQGEIILLIDDDAIAPADWVERHLAAYEDPLVGAVGGPAVNHQPDGTPFPTRAVEPVGKLTWFGRVLGNMYDHIPEWRARPPIEVDHLVGYNMSLRREAFDRFEESLRSYWNLFETEACLQVKARGCKILFDFGNVVDHHPSNTAYVGDRQGDLTIKSLNPAYNQAYILARWSPAGCLVPRWLYLMLVGTTNQPALATLPLAVRRYGNPGRELRLAAAACMARWQGWRDGLKARRSAGRPKSQRPTVASTP